MPAFVYFDLGNVLWTFNEDRACRNASRLLGVDPDLVRRAVYESGLQRRYECGQVSTDQFAQCVLTSIDSLARVTFSAQVNSTKLVDALSDMFVPIESMQSVLDRLRRRRRVPLGVLSNTCRSHWNWIQRQRHPMMTERFDAVVLSFEVGVMKPAEAIYRVAEESAGVSGEQILFLDDKAENVDAARKHRWQAEQCHGGEEAIAILRRYALLD